MSTGSASRPEVVAPRMPIPTEGVSRLCGEYGVRELSLFGSVLRDDFSARSDVDVLVEFAADADITLLDLAGLKCDLEDLLGRSVDLVEKDCIKPFLRGEILSTRRVIYVAPS
ncbi:MAG: nucleotidyltransferase family protein [Thermaerobacter sp.]|nr:nucleotidyltransferase family protein [Thermaerobacter sp.]